MYGSSTEKVVLRRIFLGIICDVFTVHICYERAQIQSLKSFTFEGWFWESVLKKLFNNDDEKCSKESAVN